MVFLGLEVLAFFGVFAFFAFSDFFSAVDLVSCLLLLIALSPRFLSSCCYLRCLGLGECIDIRSDSVDSDAKKLKEGKPIILHF